MRWRECSMYINRGPGFFPLQGIFGRHAGRLGIRPDDAPRGTDAAYAANLFNPSPTGNARFSPIRDEAGAVIPTLYAATTPRGALMETIFHDVPYKAGFKRVSTSRMARKFHSTLAFHVDFRLVDLSRVALRKLGVAPSHLIDTTKAHYPKPGAGLRRSMRNTRRRRGCAGPAGKTIGRKRSCSSGPESNLRILCPPGVLHRSSKAARSTISQKRWQPILESCSIDRGMTGHFEIP